MIDKIFNIERLEYRSKLNVVDFKGHLNAIFDQGTFSFIYNLAGKFISDNEFKVTDKWTIGLYIRGIENDPAYLKGKIIDAGEGSIVRITVRPNSIFSIFGIVLPLAGLFILYVTGFGSEAGDGLIVGLAFVIIGLIFYPLGRLFRNRLRHKFEQYLDLRRVE